MSIKISDLLKNGKKSVPAKQPKVKKIKPAIPKDEEAEEDYTINVEGLAEDPAEIPTLELSQGPDPNDPKQDFPPTNYNSQEGTVDYLGKRYKHGDIGPDGLPISCPILTDEQWAYKFEAFPVEVTIPDPITGAPIDVIEYLPAKFNCIDRAIMTWIRKNQYSLILVFRDGHKSSNLIRFVKREILDHHKTALYFADTGTNAEKFSRQIRDELMGRAGNLELIRQYGHVVSKRGKSSRSIYFKFQAQNSAIGPGLAIGSAGGVSQLGSHPNIVALDDAINEEMASSAAERERTERWFFKQVMAMCKGRTKVIAVGTIKDADDLYMRMIASKMFAVLKIPAILEWPNNGQSEVPDKANPDQWSYVKNAEGLICGVSNIRGGKVSLDVYHEENWHQLGRVQYRLLDNPSSPIDANRMALQEFLIKRAEIGPIYFESEYQLNAISVQKGFLKFTNLKFFRMDSLPFNSQFLLQGLVVFFDQAFGENNRADNNVLWLMNKYEENYYIVDIFVWKNIGGVEAKVDMIQQVRELYPTIDRWGIETDLINSSDAKYIQRVMPELNWVPIAQRHQPTQKIDPTQEEGIVHQKIPYIFTDMKIPPNKLAKYCRILDQWGTDLSIGKFYLREGINEVAMEELHAEYSFPRCAHVDVLDAGASAKIMLDVGDVQSDFFMISSSSAHRSPFVPMR